MPLTRLANGRLAAGPLDALVVLRDTRTSKFHPCIFLELPWPGPPQPYSEVVYVRLQSWGHLARGTYDWAEAQRMVAAWRADVLLIEDACVDLAPLPWSGMVPLVLHCRNWRALSVPLSQVVAFGSLTAQTTPN